MTTHLLMSAEQPMQPLDDARRPVGTPAGPLKSRHDAIVDAARRNRSAVLAARLKNGLGWVRRGRDARSCVSPQFALLTTVSLPLSAMLLLGLGAGMSEIAAMAAVFLASLTSSIAGFAFSAICGAMLFHLIDGPVRVVQIMIVCSIASQVMMNWSIRNDITWRPLAPFLLGGLAGLPIGLLILTTASRILYNSVFGGLLIFYAGYKLLHPSVTPRVRHVGWDILIGCLGGVTGGAAGFPGAFVTIWCGVKGWSKERQRALYQPFILVMQGMTIASLLWLHHGGPDAAAGASFQPTDWLLVPAALSGTACGLICFTYLNDRQFALAVNLLLLISGLAFIL